MAQHLTRYDSSNTRAWSIALSERQTRRFHAVSVASQAGLPPCCGVRGDDNRPHRSPFDRCESAMAARGVPSSPRAAGAPARESA